MLTNLSNETHFHENLRCDFPTSSIAVQVSKILAYAIILIFGLLGNAFVVVIVYKRQELRNTINYFIVNMAVSDFVFPLTTIPLSIKDIASNSSHWPLGGTAGLILCKLRWFLQSVSITVSTISLVWIAVDRFLAVVFPMKLHLISSRFRASAIASTWLVAMLANAFLSNAYELVDENEETVCSNSQNVSFAYLTYAKLYTLLFQIAPLLATATLYSGIAVSLRRQDKAFAPSSRHSPQVRSPQVRDLQQLVHKKKLRAIKMAFCIMAAFYICIFPIVLYFILWEYKIAVSCSFSNKLLFIASVMLFLSSAINPVICMTFVQSYRQALKAILCSCSSKWSPATTSRKKEENEERELVLQIRHN